MKKLKLLLILIIINISLFAQSTKLGKVEYLEIIDLHNFNFDKEQYAENIHSLYFTSDESIYLYDKDGKTSISLSNGIPLGSDGCIMGSIDTRSKYYTNFKEKKLKAIVTDYNIKLQTIENLAKINWKIGKETKKIGKYNCIKASCKFRGREYEAWFTPQIPIAAGPWKLQGLPGLILQAKDLNSQVQYIFKSIEYPIEIANDFQQMLNLKSSEFLSPRSLKSIYKQKSDEETKRIMSYATEGVTIEIEEAEIIMIEKEFEEGIDAGIEYKALK